MQLGNTDSDNQEVSSIGGDLPKSTSGDAANNSLNNADSSINDSVELGSKASGGTKDISTDSTFPDSQPTSSITDDLPVSTPEPVSNLPNNSSTPTVDYGRVSSDVSAAPSTGTTQSIKAKRRFAPVLAFLIILIIFAFGVGVSIYFLRGQGSENKGEPENIVSDVPATEQDVSSDVVYPTAESVDSKRLKTIQDLSNAVAEMQKEEGVYPWDELGDKPIPIMSKVLNPANKSTFAWLDPSNNNKNTFNNYYNVTSFVVSEEVQEVRLLGFNSWYAVCFEPVTQEFKETAAYDALAEEVGEGTGQYVCVKKQMGQVTGETNTGSEFENTNDSEPKSVFGDLN